MLEIKDLHASINGKEILKGINLSVKPGEIHVSWDQSFRKKHFKQCIGW
jgi:ABC-type histidine transport system ATPase subunit